MDESPLSQLEAKFSIIDLVGQWYVLDNDQISRAMEGIGYVKYYKSRTLDFFSSDISKQNR